MALTAHKTWSEMKLLSWFSVMKTQMLQQIFYYKKVNCWWAAKLWFRSLRGQWREKPKLWSGNGRAVQSANKAQESHNAWSAGEDQIPGERLHNEEKHIIVRDRQGSSITIISPDRQAEQEGEPENRVTVQSESLKPWRASCWPVNADYPGSNWIKWFNKKK